MKMNIAHYVMEEADLESLPPVWSSPNLADRADRDGQRAFRRRTGLCGPATRELAGEASVDGRLEAARWAGFIAGLSGRLVRLVVGPNGGVSGSSRSAWAVGLDTARRFGFVPARMLAAVGEARTEARRLGHGRSGWWLDERRAVSPSRRRTLRNVRRQWLAWRAGAAIRAEQKAQDCAWRADRHASWLASEVRSEARRMTWRSGYGLRRRFLGKERVARLGVLVTLIRQRDAAQNVARRTAEVAAAASAVVQAALAREQARMELLRVAATLPDDGRQVSVWLRRALVLGWCRKGIGVELRRLKLSGGGPVSLRQLVLRGLPIDRAASLAYDSSAARRYGECDED